MRVVVVMLGAMSLLGCSQSPMGVGGAFSEGMPSGTVVAFAGETIPKGWTLCDGGTTPSGLVTPDLRDRFVLGAGSPGIGERGGAATHLHEGTVTKSEGPNTGVDKDDNKYVPNQAHTHGLEMLEAEHLPPYVRLAYIMKD